jgi:hypothetical protein
MKLEIDPETVMICHRTDCQTLSGSAFRTVQRKLSNLVPLLPRFQEGEGAISE